MAAKNSSNGQKVSDFATKDVISVPSTMRIIEGVQLMSRNNFRRLPITDAGTGKLTGLITLTDIVDMLGGGSRYNLVAKKHKGNLLKALNDSLREIMTENVTGLPESASVKDAAKLLIETGHGAYPIVKTNGVLCGIITEYDIIKVLAGEENTTKVRSIMTKNPRVIEPDVPLSTVTREIVEHGYRRFPVVKDGLLIGIITATDVMNYIGRGRVFSEMKDGTIDEVLNLPVREVMTAADIKTLSADATVSEAAELMLKNGIGAFPVMDKGRLAGIITEFDLVRELANE
ncbi:MAG TPA: CBS domain-containing protein [Methanocorpusculum sp.]|nr:CBS domain-containing protein [Methanocorpusculum sp.]